MTVLPSLRFVAGAGFAVTLLLTRVIQLRATVIVLRANGRDGDPDDCPRAPPDTHIT